MVSLLKLPMNSALGGDLTLPESEVSQGNHPVSFTSSDQSRNLVENVNFAPTIARNTNRC